MKPDCYSRQGLHAQQATLTCVVYLKGFRKPNVEEPDSMSQLYPVRAFISPSSTATAAKAEQ